MGCDPGTGENNYSCGQFLSRTRLDIPIVYHTSEMAVTMTNEINPLLEKIYDITGIEPVVAYERGNGGVFELTRLSGLNRNRKYRIFQMPEYGKVDSDDESGKIGWDTNAATRPKMLSDLKDAVDGRLFEIYDKITIEEMFSFIVTQTGNLYKAKAEKGSLDDTVMALAIAWQMHLILPMVSNQDFIGKQFERSRNSART